jgi:membrane protease YdiL (CAAX protease family)
VELLVAGAVISAGLLFNNVVFIFGSSPWLAVIGGLFLWWRRPRARGFGFVRPKSITRTLIVGALVGIGYQFLGTWVIEPAIARLTTGALPDASGFRSLVGNTRALEYWLAQVWVMVAIFEETAFRGWILTRLAELGRFSQGAWIGAAVASSALFGLIHAYQGLSGMIATGLTGLVFATIYLATGRNLWTAVVAHGVLDTLGFILIYFGVYPGL